MDSLYSSRNRAERLIALGRIALMLLFLLSILLNPAVPTTPHSIPATYVLLSFYLSYALLLIPIVWRSSFSILFFNRLGLFIHAMDLALITALIYITGGITSPFFAYYMFLLVSAALRWHVQGILWTAAAVLVIYLSLGGYAVYVLHDPAVDLNYFIIRGVSLAVIAILLSYLSRHEQRLRTELLRLSAWPRNTLQKSAVRIVLKTVAGIFNAPRVLMIWKEEKTPWLHWVNYSEDEFRTHRELPTTFAPSVAKPLMENHFLCRNTQALLPQVLYRSGGRWRRWQGAPFHPDLQARFNLCSVLCLRLRGEHIQGHLLVMEGKEMTSDELLLGEIVARQVVVDMEQIYLQQRLLQAATQEERIRLARELHDGLLQSLTVLALQAEIADRKLITNPRAAKENLTEIKATLATEQRELRQFVQQLKPGGSYLLNANFNLALELEKLVKRIERQWGLTVELNMVLPGDTTPLKALAHEIYRLVQEALVNAARHAQATWVRVAVSREENQIRIKVADNGGGFPFQGRRDLAALLTQGEGPLSLQERTASLGGNLIIDSSASGASLKITLPLEQ